MSIMHWTKYLDNPEGVLRIYGEKLPALTGCRLLRADLDENGSTLMMALDLMEFPLVPPKKWQDQGFNQCQIKLSFVPLEALDVRGWGTENVGDLILARGDKDVEFQFTSGGTDIVGTCGFVILSNIEAYLKGWD